MVTCYKHHSPFEKRATYLWRSQTSNPKRPNIFGLLRNILSIQRASYLLRPVASLQNDFIVAPRHVEQEELKTVFVHVLGLVLVFAEPCEGELANWSPDTSEKSGVGRELRVTCLLAPSIRVACHVELVADKFKKCGSLAKLLRFWCCQVQKLRKCRNIAAFQTCR